MSLDMWPNMTPLHVQICSSKLVIPLTLIQTESNWKWQIFFSWNHYAKYCLNIKYKKITTCGSIIYFWANHASILLILFTQISTQQNLVSFSQDTAVTTLGGCNLFIQRNSDDVDGDDEALSIPSPWYWTVCPTAESYFSWKDCHRCEVTFEMPVPIAGVTLTEANPNKLLIQLNWCEYTSMLHRYHM